MSEIPPYWQRRHLAKLANNLSAKVKKKQEADKNSKFFEQMATLNPGKCQNCGAPTTYQFVHKHENQAHILPKEFFKSIMHNPINIWWACKNCHDFYDREPQEKVATMAIIPVLKARVLKLWKKISFENRRRVPYFLYPSSEEIEQIK